MFDPVRRERELLSHGVRRNVDQTHRVFVADRQGLTVRRERARTTPLERRAAPVASVQTKVVSTPLPWSFLAWTWNAMRSPLASTTEATARPPSPSAPSGGRNTRSRSPVSTSQTWTVRSSAVEMSFLLSGVNTRERSLPAWPPGSRTRRTRPPASGSPSSGASSGGTGSCSSGSCGAGGWATATDSSRALPRTDRNSMRDMSSSSARCNGFVSWGRRPACRQRHAGRLPHGRRFHYFPILRIGNGSTTHGRLRNGCCR